LPILTGQKSNVRDWVFCHYDPNWGNFTPKTFAFDERWKVYSSGEIYDIKTDPDEKKSLDPTTLKASDKNKVGVLREVIRNMYR
ncbi:MAG: arylsulfatase, partial [Spirosomataceae bacterium]